jgi:hypothetical protein
MYCILQTSLLLYIQQSSARVPCLGQPLTIPLAAFGKWAALRDLLAAWLSMSSSK